jgi:uncharacterized protein (TIGR02453 family)
MISRNITDFLKKLSENNNREWFQANKKLYDIARKEFEDFTKQFILIIAAFDKEVAWLEPKDCIFRIYRDTRFSNDKTPYKTNFGAYVVKGGRKSEFAGYYINIEPNNYFLSGGIWMPLSENLKKVRTEIFQNPDEFLNIINSPTFKKHFGKLSDEDMLKTVPKDFPKDFKYIDLLHYRSYVALKPVPENLVSNIKFMDELTKVFQALYPFNKFINNALANN